jgi:GNAT superfamily N-acetyltransferase
MTELAIVTGYRAGFVGRVTELHAVYYGLHWQFGTFFETKVASEMAEFVNRYDEDRDGIWSVAVGERIEAAIVVDGANAESKGAHLRWFIASDTVRGKGVGFRLLQAATTFCERKKYRKVYLWTFYGLDDACYLYENAGFKLVEKQIGNQWGSTVEEQRYEKINEKGA